MRLASFSRDGSPTRAGALTGADEVVDLAAAAGRLLGEVPA